MDDSSIARHEKALAKKMLQTVIKDFQDNGINEGYVKVLNFVVSVTDVYALTR